MLAPGFQYSQSCAALDEIQTTEGGSLTRSLHAKLTNCLPSPSTRGLFGLPGRGTQTMSDLHRTDDLRIEHIRDLLSPSVFMKEIALSEGLEDTVTRTRQAAEDIIKGRSDRLLVVAGPCSIHDRDSALDYAGKLHAARARYADDLEIFMRVYFE